ncbi:MAG: MCE family protein [Aeromonadales bacterium]|nr:MCE family protein [Aeromonadales bacterium]
METRAHHILIGAFTLLVAVAILLFSLWMVKSGSQQDTRLYSVEFHEAVSGLTVGSAVEYSGIRVGEVERLSLNPNNPAVVLAQVRISKQVPIKQDTKARLALANITGASNIQLSGGTPTSPNLEAPEGQLPLIIAEPSPFAKLRLNSEEVITGFKSLLDNANQLFSKENGENFSQMLANLNATTGIVAEQKDDISAGIKNLTQASQQINDTMSQAARMLSQLEGQLNTKGEQVLTNADRTLASLAKISNDLDQLLTNNQQALNSGLQGMMEIEPTLRELRSTLATLGDMARKLDAEPSRFLRGGEDVREFQP